MKFFKKILLNIFISFIEISNINSFPLKAICEMKKSNILKRNTNSRNQFEIDKHSNNSDFFILSILKPGTNIQHYDVQSGTDYWDCEPVF